MKSLLSTIFTVVLFLITVKAQFLQRNPDTLKNIEFLSTVKPEDITEAKFQNLTDKVESLLT